MTLTFSYTTLHLLEECLQFFFPTLFGKKDTHTHFNVFLSFWWLIHLYVYPSSSHPVCLSFYLSFPELSNRFENGWEFGWSWFAFKPCFITNTISIQLSVCPVIHFGKTLVSLSICSSSQHITMFLCLLSILQWLFF